MRHPVSIEKIQFAGFAALLVTHLAALTTGSLDRALGAGAMAFLLTSRIRGRDSVPASPSRGDLTIGFLLALLTAPAVLSWNFFDEEKWIGHFSIPAHLAYAPYPPSLPGFPGLELRYHYAFDLAVAVLHRLTSLSIERTVDLLSLAFLGLAGALFAQLGRKWFGPRGWLAAPLVLLGGGLPIAPALPPDGCLYAFPLCHLLFRTRVHGATINPPLGIYFQQHPWSIGLVIFALLLRDFGRPAQLVRWSWRRATEFIVLTALLSLAHFVLFANWIGWLLVHGAIVAGRTPRRAWRLALVAAAALGLASQLRGFWLPAYSAGGFVPAIGGFVGDWRGSIGWTLLSLGGLAGAGALGFPRLFRRLPAIPAAAVVNLVLLHALRYAHSTDVYKFETAASIAFALAAAAWFAMPGERRFVGPGLRSATTVVWVAVCVVWSTAFYAVFWAPFWFPPAVIAAEFPRAGSELDLVLPDLPAGELTYATRPLAAFLAMRAGWHVPWTDDGVAASYGVDPQTLRLRARLRGDLPSDAPHLRANGVRWLCLTNAERARWRTFLHSARGPFFEPVESTADLTLFRVRYGPALAPLPAR